MRSTGEKKWMPMKRAGSLKVLASDVIGSVEVLEPKIVSLADHLLRLGDHFFLDLAVLEYRLDDEVAILERAVIGSRRYARQQRIAVGGRGAAAIDLVGGELLRMRLAFVGQFLIAVDEHHVDAGERADIGDAGAHEAGAEDADLPDRLRRHFGRPARALVELLHRNEQRADHRRRFRRAQDLREVPRLDPQRLIHRQLQAFIDHLHDGARGRIVVVGLAAVERVGGRPEHQLRPSNRPARPAV